MNKLFNVLKLILGNERGEVSLTGGGDGAAAQSGGVEGDPAGDSGGGVSGGSVDGGVKSDNPLGGLPAEVSFPDGLDDVVKSDPSLKVFIDEGNKINYANLIKSYVHAQKKIGEKGVLIPDDKSTDEDVQNFYNKLRPSDIEKYEVKNSLPDGTPLDENMFNSFKEAAHQNGLSSKQAQSVLDWYNNQVSEAQKVHNQQAEVEYNKQVEALKNDWGDAVDRELNVAQQGLKEFADENTIKYLQDRGLDKDVVLIRLFNKIGHGLGEDKFDSEAHGHYGVTKEDAERKINEHLSDYKGPYHNADHPNHKIAVNEVQKLMAKLESSGSAA